MKYVQRQEAGGSRMQYAVVPLPAVLNRATVACVRIRLLELLGGKVNVRVDMSDIRTMDTAAIAVFVECLRAAKDHGVTFAVDQPPECARRLMRLTKLDQLLAGTFSYVHGVGGEFAARREHRSV